MYPSEAEQLIKHLRIMDRPMRFFEDPNQHGIAFTTGDWFYWNHLTKYDVAPTGPYRGLTSLTVSTETRLGVNLSLATNVVSNGVWERMVQPIVQQQAQGATGYADFFALPMYWHMPMNQATSPTGNTGERYQGITLGDYWDINTPWQTGWGSSTNVGGKLSLFWNYTAASWQVLVFAPGQAPQLLTCAYQAPFAVDTFPAELALLWVPPTDGVNSRIVAMLNGQVALDVLNNSIANQLSTSTGGFGIFLTQGTSASSFPDAMWYRGSFWRPHVRNLPPWGF